MRYRVETRCTACKAGVTGASVRPDENGSFLSEAMAALPKACPACGTAVPAEAEVTLYAGIVPEEMGLSMARRPAQAAGEKPADKNAA